jgi:hypothetical protein
MNTPTTIPSQDLLHKYRYDGKRFWYKDAQGDWFTVPARSIALFLSCELDMPRKDAIRMRESLKSASRQVQDDVWSEQVRWLDFTKGRHLYVWLGTIEFCDPYTGRSKRSLKIRVYNERLRRNFPSKPQVPEDCPIGFLGV